MNNTTNPIILRQRLLEEMTAPYAISGFPFNVLMARQCDPAMLLNANEVSPLWYDGGYYLLRRTIS